jgi:aspartate 1-decarboxylase
MLRRILKSKIHSAVVTKRDLEYEGSIGIDGELLSKADIFPGEEVQVLNYSNGERFTTYVIEEKKGSGIISLYGPAARKGEVGDRVCILSYGLVTDDEIRGFSKKVLFLDADNRITSSKTD